MVTVVEAIAEALGSKEKACNVWERVRPLKLWELPDDEERDDEI